MTDLQIRQGYANGTLTDCDECGATMKNGGECEACKDRVSCDQCAALMIQGVFCHETGCPNTHSRFDSESGDWVKQRKCGECGCTVDADDLCCNAEVEEDSPWQHAAEKVCDDCDQLLEDCECGLEEDEEDTFEHDDTDSLEDRGITLGSYAS